jgi:hypothetical protein
MWEPRRLTISWTFVACYRDNFTTFSYNEYVNYCYYLLELPPDTLVWSPLAEMLTSYRDDKHVIINIIFLWRRPVFSVPSYCRACRSLDLICASRVSAFFWVGGGGAYTEQDNKLTISTEQSPT